MFNFLKTVDKNTNFVFAYGNNVNLTKIIQMLTINQIYTHSFSFTQKEVELFAEVTGDKNPVHLNANYAATTMFKKPIMHGMLGASLFSKVFGTLFPGEGTIYLKQSLVFLKPMYVDVKYKAVFTVKEVNTEKHRAIIETQISTETDEVCTTGEATVLNMTQI